MKMISEDQLSQIVQLANSVPQEYRQKCFEILLNNFLYQHKLSETLEKPKPSSPEKEQGSKPTDFILTIDVKAFLSQYSLDESKLWKLFYVQDSELRPVYKIKSHKKAKAQIELALLMALEQALINGQFQVSIEDLRSRCKDQKCHDTANFMAIIKSRKILFKSIDSKKPLILSPEGKAELAEIVEEFSS